MPAAFGDLGEETHVWRARLDHSGAEVESLARLLAPGERQRASRFHFESDRRHFIAARGLLRLLLAQYTGIAPDRIDFAYGPQGKPALADGSDPQFNVAHSHGVALFVFTLGAPVGVDLEHIRSIEHETLASRFFSAAECAALERLPPEQRQEAFFMCWTRKEAYVKGLGGGLSVPLDRFDVAVAPNQPAALLADRGEPDAARQWALHDVDAGDGFRAALAVRKYEGRIRFFETSVAAGQLTKALSVR